MNPFPCTDGWSARSEDEPGSNSIAWERDGVALESDLKTTTTELKSAPRILVVEDDIFFRQLNTDVLAQAGYKVESVEDGAAAWQALEANRYDLMITDNNMPNVSGVELLCRLHASRMAMPVIMATGAAPLDDLRSQAAVQPVAILVKPYAIAELVRIVRKVLNDMKPVSAPMLTKREDQTRTE